MSTFDEKWEEVHKKRQWGKYPNIDVVKFVARNFFNSERNVIKILDLGCGAGANTWFLAREGFSAYGIDGSKSAIENADSYLQSSNLNAKLHVGDISETPYGNDYFDAIIECGVLCANLKSGISVILDECHRILKPQGLIFSTHLFNPETSSYGKGTKLEDNTYTDIPVPPFEGIGRVHYFVRDEVSDLFEQASFDSLQIDKTTYTEFNGKVTISYYLAHGIKPAG